MRDAVGYRVAEGKGRVWGSHGWGGREGGNRCLMLGEVLDLQWDEGGGEVDPLQLILCCVVHVV